MAYDSRTPIEVAFDSTLALAKFLISYTWWGALLGAFGVASWQCAATFAPLTSLSASQQLNAVEFSAFVTTFVFLAILVINRARAEW